MSLDSSRDFEIQSGLGVKVTGESVGKAVREV